MQVLGEDSVKEVDGYKIRLIKLEELRNNLGYGESNTVNDSVQNWVYNTGVYWTMTPSYSTVWGNNGTLQSYYTVCNNGVGVRPVINLLKEAIE